MLGTYPKTTLSASLNCTGLDERSCHFRITQTFQLLFQMLALTSRVTKLGTLVAWADAHDQVNSYLMSLHRRLTGLDTKIRFDELVKMVDATLDKNKKDDSLEIQNWDQRSQSCWPNLASHAA